MKHKIGLIALFSLFVIHSICGQFYFGADLSYIHEMEDCGAIYKENNLAKDPYEILHDHGANLIRLRLWHTPSWYDQLNQGNRYSDLADVRMSISRAKNIGMEVLLDFQLSDTWADPSHQIIPAAWAGVVDNLPVLQDSLYQYIYNVLTSLSDDHLLPDLVQIGNETNKGILLSQQVNDQGWSVDWTRNAALFNTAIAAVRTVENVTGSSIKIALHIADPSEVNWWIDQFWMHGVRDFDIIGISYYYQYHQDLIGAVGEVIADMKSQYPGKEVMLLETAYPWTSAYEDNANNLLHTVYAGYPFSPENQEQWMVDLTQTVIDHGGDGVVYWEPGWVSTGCATRYGVGSNWENSTFFDFNNNVLADGGIGWMIYPYDFLSSTTETEVDDLFEIKMAGNEIWILQKENSVLKNIVSVNVISVNGVGVIKQELTESGKASLLKINKPLAPGIYFGWIEEQRERRSRIFKLTVF